MCQQFFTIFFIFYDSDGVIRSRLFYCDPSSPGQKGVCENNHEFIRRIEAPNSKKNFSIDAVSNIANALDIDIELLFEKREDNEEK